MIYIPGAKFTVGAAPIKRGGSLLANRMASPCIDRSSPLIEGQIYTLHHVKRNSDGSYVYQFKGSEGVVDIPFTNQRVAEDYIAGISGQADTLKSTREQIRRVNEN